VDAHGEVIFSTPLSWGTPKQASALLPYPSGGVIVELDRTVSWVTETGELRAQSRVSSPIDSMVADDGGIIYMLGEDGSVFRWDLDSAPRAIASFGTRSRHLVLSPSGELYANVGRSSFGALDPRQNEVSERIGLEPESFAAASTVLRDGSILLVTRQGLLLGYDRAGSEKFQVALQAPGTLGPAGSDFLAPIADANCTLAVAGESLSATLISRDGTVKPVREAICLTPIGLVPAGAGRLLLSCSSGALWAIGENPKNSGDSTEAPRPAETAPADAP
jgi:hypothetical protein